MTGHAAADRRRHRGVAGDRERWIRDARRPEPEATGVHIGRGVAARAVAIERADRHVITGRGDEGHVDEGPDRRAMAAQTPGHTLVSTGDGVNREVARRRVALRTHGGCGNVIRGLRGCGEQICCERGCRHVAVAAVASGRMLGVVRARSRVSSGERRARGHPHVGRALVTGRARGHRRRHRRMAGDGECGIRDVRSAELETTGVHILGAVAARTVAVEAADRDVIGGGTDDRDVGEGPGDGRAVAGEAARHALVGTADRVGGVIARGGVALRTGRAGRNVIRGFAACGHVAEKSRYRSVTGRAIAIDRMKFVERGRTRVSGRSRAAGLHPDVERGLVTGRAGTHRRHGRVTRRAEGGI